MLTPPQISQSPRTEGARLRIAFINQPIGALSVSPLKSDSLGLWTYHVATRFAADSDVLLYTPQREGEGPAEELHRGVRILRFPVHRDEQWVRFHGRARSYLRRRGVPLNPRRPHFASPIAYLEYILRISLDLRRRGCDVVHLHNFSQFVPILRALNPDLRIVINMQCEWLATLCRSAIERRLRSVDLIVGCSEFIVDGPRKRFPKLADRCHVLDNGFDPGLFPKAPHDSLEKPPAPAAGPTLLYVGRLSPEKGIHVLIDAFPEIARAHPGTRLQLIGGHSSAPTEYLIDLSDDPMVLGLTRFYEGDKGYVKMLKERVPKALESQVDFIEKLPQAELLERYQRADLFIFPSACNEAFGMPPVEAMACGVPVVASRIGGLPEVVTDGETGLLVEPHDPEHLARTVCDLLGDEPRLGRLGAAGPAHSLRYTWDRVAARLRELLREI